MKEKRNLTWDGRHLNSDDDGKRSTGQNNGCYEKILLHIPHSSTSFPADSTFTFKDLDEEEKLLIDYYTNELFIPLQQKGISPIIFPYCRLFCDVERLAKDPLENKGLGISYHRRVNRDKFEERFFSTLTEAFHYYADFHAHVAKIIVEASLKGQTLLIDCHSFSAQPNLLNSNPPEIDICIGYNDDETKPHNKTIEQIATHFMGCGYHVGINVPFSNSKTFAVPVNYHSVMIEVNKKLYMNELTRQKTDGYRKLKSEILALYEVLLNQSEPTPSPHQAPSSTQNQQQSRWC